MVLQLKVTVIADIQVRLVIIPKILEDALELIPISIRVIKNFNNKSFKDQVRPLSILHTQKDENLLVRYEGDPG